jgi:hypothetical protein
MRRKPHSANLEVNSMSIEDTTVKELSDASKWLDTIQTAIYLKRFRKDGSPSVGAIRNLIYRKQLKARKFLGRLFFNRLELDRLIAISPTVGG